MVYIRCSCFAHVSAGHFKHGLQLQHYAALTERVLSAVSDIQKSILISMVFIDLTHTCTGKIVLFFLMSHNLSKRKTAKLYTMQHNSSSQSFYICKPFFQLYVSCRLPFYMQYHNVMSP